MEATFTKVEAGPEMLDAVLMDGKRFRVSCRLGGSLVQVDPGNRHTTGALNAMIQASGIIDGIRHES